jgi:hypothetical protein
VLAWFIGVFGVALAGLQPPIGIWTIGCFVFAVLTAWRTASE